jgi:hypothetical protein
MRAVKTNTYENRLGPTRNHVTTNYSGQTETETSLSWSSNSFSFMQLQNPVFLKKEQNILPITIHHHVIIPKATRNQTTHNRTELAKKQATRNETNKTRKLSSTKNEPRLTNHQPPGAATAAAARKQS